MIRVKEFYVFASKIKDQIFNINTEYAPDFSKPRVVTKTLYEKLQNELDLIAQTLILLGEMNARIANSTNMRNMKMNTN